MFKLLIQDGLNQKVFEVTKVGATHGCGGCAFESDDIRCVGASQVYACGLAAVIFVEKSSQ